MIYGLHYKSNKTFQPEHPSKNYRLPLNRNILLVFMVAGCMLLPMFLIGCENPSSKQTGTSEQPAVSDAAQAPQSAEQSLKAATEVVSESEAFQPFFIFLSKGSRQNHYVPSGFMPNGNCVTFSDAWQENCRAGEGDSCIRVNYDVECSRNDQKWAGVYWLNPANNWGSRQGGYNLTGAQKLTFWAKGEKGGEQIQEFTMGGINGDYPDSDTAVMGPVILGTQWRQYAIDLRGKDLSYISGGFAWTTSADVNPEDCTFYLDDIRFE